MGAWVLDPLGFVGVWVGCSVVGGLLVQLAASSAVTQGRFSANHSARLQLGALLLLGLLPFAVLARLGGGNQGVWRGGAAWLNQTPAEKFSDLSASVEPASAWMHGGSGGAVLVGLWALGCALILLRLAWRLRCLLRFREEAQRVQNPALHAVLERAQRTLGNRRRVELLTHPAARTPLVWGVRRPFLVLPPEQAVAGSDLTAAHLTFLHEMAHLDHRDTPWKLAAEFICALHWFNPLAWRARRRLGLAHEVAADHRVLCAGVRASEYSAHLLSLFRTARSGVPRMPGASLAAGPGPLETRLVSILDAERDGARGERGALGWVGLLVLGVLASAAFAQTADELVPGSTEALDARVSPVMARALDANQAAGAAISVVKNGELLYARGFGLADTAAQRSVAAESTVFRIGSVSKVVTGIAVMRCVDLGLLDLDADVNEYLTAFQVGDEFPEPVRVRHLLTHTAGFDQFGYGRHALGAGDVISMEEFLQNDLVRVRPPGGLSCYDTYAITLAGYLVTQVSGLGFEEFLQAHLFEPMGMESSFILVPEEFEQRMAVGYAFDGRFVAQRWEFMNTDPASTVNSTVVDMSRLMTMLLREGRVGDVQVLQPESARAMLQRQAGNHPDLPGTGLTLFEDHGFGHEAWMHSGSMTGFGCWMYLIPEQDLGVFVAYNREGGRIAGEAMGAVIAELVGEPPAPALRERVEGTDLGPYVGEYANNGYNHTRPERGGWGPQPFEITLAEGGLLYRDDVIHPVGTDLFQRDDGDLLRFVRGADGGVTHMLVQQTVFERFDAVSRLDALLGAEELRLLRGPYEAALEDYRARRAAEPEARAVSEVFLNSLGYELLGQARVALAVRVLRLASDLYPESANAWDSLGEAYRADGQRPLSMECYRRALRIDPELPSAVQALVELQRE